MSSIDFDGNQILLDDDESVLEALLRQGHKIPYGCRSGVCQSCIMSSESSEGLAPAQKGLTDTQKSLNYFLSCLCRPAEPMCIKSIADSGKMVQAVVIDKRWLSDSVIRLRLRAPITYRPGQYITLWKGDEVARSFSLASHPKLNDYLELHIRRLPDGKVSGWIADSVEVDDKIGIQGPIGQCIYSSKPHQPLLLTAVGTGLSPVYGILQDALVNGHIGSINVVIGAAKPSHFYMVDELLKIASLHSHVNLHLLTKEFEEEQHEYSFGNHSVQSEDIYDFCSNLVSGLSNARVYLCGAESFTRKMRKVCFLAGASMTNISSDAFIAS